MGGVFENKTGVISNEIQKKKCFIIKADVAIKPNIHSVIVNGRYLRRKLFVLSIRFCISFFNKLGSTITKIKLGNMC